MESDKQKQKYPPPPDYFKEFTSPNIYSPPKISCLNKLDKLIIFGSEYSTKKINISYNPVNVPNISNVKDNMDKLLKESKARNIELFRNIKKESDVNINSDNMKLNIIEELEKEIIFLKKRYERLLEDISKNINKAGNKNKMTLIGITMQKINFYLIALRRKAILKKTIDSYEKQIEDCKKTSETFENNKKNFRKYLEEESKNLLLDE